VGDPKIVQGMVREALDFDGVDDCVDCGNDESLNIVDLELAVDFLCGEFYNMPDTSG
jgi:hypothetical protein